MEPPPAAAFLLVLAERAAQSGSVSCGDEKLREPCDRDAIVQKGQVEVPSEAEAAPVGVPNAWASAA